ncbi:MAG: hypothetical protein M3357_05590 [Actinomycetota bacterium]|nr:hypothetical protein [Actinomycetota bacterium]
MTDAGYVITGWVITGAALGGYLTRIWVRARRARQVLGPDGEPDRPGSGLSPERWR